ncbi:MAG: acetyl-CoA acetyltransferase [Syntrophus sp. (in: bacteria)]|nr:acetyl-CoA acetyltransferase [Syntrophus sp. (in: bacteria)]
MNMTLVPIIAGAAQITQRKEADPVLDPLGLMIHASRLALAEAGAEGLPPLIDTVCVVNSFSCDDEQLPDRLSRALGLNPRDNIYSLIGGNTPQMLVNEFSRDIAAGRRQAVLIAGAEAIHAMVRGARGKVKLDWPDNITWRQVRDTGLPVNFDTLLRLGCEHETKRLHAAGEKHPEPNNRAEEAFDLFLPQFMYPFFETALRATSGRTPEEHRLYMGSRCEHLAGIAARNPHAWERKAATADEITCSTAKNHYVAYPYTVRMVANIKVDQSAAVILTSVAAAEKLGSDCSRRVYPMGGAEFRNIWHVSRRPCLYDSPAITEASRLALGQAGISLSEIGVFDIYSCFPSAVEIARRAIGIPEDDPRDLSVTGGLAYFGGPGNNYTLHAIASVVERIRRDRSLKAMVTANGWFNSKHAVGVYGAEAPLHPWEDRDDEPIQRVIDAQNLPEPVERAEGRLTVEAYMIRYGQDGRPERGTVIGRLSDGRRALADIDASEQRLQKLEQIELVGRTGNVRFNPLVKRNLVAFSASVYAGF